jgi:hypothetical protein
VPLLRLPTSKRAVRRRRTSLAVVVATATALWLVPRGDTAPADAATPAAGAGAVKGRVATGQAVTLAFGATSTSPVARRGH